MSGERGGWEVGAEGFGRCKTEPSKTRSAGAHAGQPGLGSAPLRSAPLRSPPLPHDSINSKDAHSEPPGGVQVKPISVNFPTRRSAQIARAPNVPFPGIWFPFPPPTLSLGAPPSHSLKIQKIRGRARSPPSEGRNGLPAGRPPPPRCKCPLRPRLPPRIRLKSTPRRPPSPRTRNPPAQTRL